MATNGKTLLLVGAGIAAFILLKAKATLSVGTFSVQSASFGIRQFGLRTRDIVPAPGFGPIANPNSAVITFSATVKNNSNALAYVGVLTQAFIGGGIILDPAGPNGLRQTIGTPVSIPAGGTATITGTVTILATDVAGAITAKAALLAAATAAGVTSQINNPITAPGTSQIVSPTLGTVNPNFTFSFTAPVWAIG